MTTDAAQIRQVPGWPQYGVTEDGRVWSFRLGRFLAQRLGTNGYLRVVFRRERKPVDKNVHWLVAVTWVDGYRPGLEANHDDGNKLNCHASNLLWTTKKGNMQHAWRSGLMERSRVAGAKLTPEGVRLIRSSKRKGVDLAREYNISCAVISEIRTGKIWRHV